MAGISYYRLKQNDFDGTTETFKPVMFENEKVLNQISIYPNPVSKDEFIINVSGVTRPGNLRILNTNGEELINREINGQNSQEISITKKMAPGIYIAILSAGLKYNVVKMVKK